MLPRPYYTPPTEAQQQVAAETTTAFLTEQAELKKAKEPLKRLLYAVDPAITDVQAAIDCHCSCHPEPHPEIHNNKVCSCQLSDEERQKQRREALKGLQELFSYDHEREELEHDEREQVLADVSRELDITITSYGGMCPFVITGTCDTVAFYLRERHEQWALTIGPENTPDVDFTVTTLIEGSMIIAEGHDTDVEPYIGAYGVERQVLTLIATTIREYLHRNHCPHPYNDAYCRDCGTPLHTNNVSIGDQSRFTTNQAAQDAAARSFQEPGTPLTRDRKRTTKP